MKRTRDHIGHAMLAVVMGGALVFAALPSHAKAAETASCADVQQGHNARLAAQADRGFPAFRSYVIRTRMIYNVDVNEAAERVQAHRAALAGCRK